MELTEHGGASHSEGWVANLVAWAASAAAVWMTSAVMVVVLQMSEPLDTTGAVMAPRKLQGDELAMVQLFQANTPSVVYITNLVAMWACVFRAA